jgi:hypothetical protein
MIRDTFRGWRELDSLARTTRSRLEEAVIDAENPWEGDDGSELEAEIMRADHPFAADLEGTTPEEALAGQGLDAALARERPEGRTIDEALAIPDDGDPDVEDELVGEGSVESDSYAAPEEAALSIRNTAPGATDHEDVYSPRRVDP